MVNGRRMSTDRFYGGVENRLQVLSDFLSLLDETGADEGKSVERVLDWFLTNTDAEEPDAAERHLGFIKTIGLIDTDNGQYKLTRLGRSYHQDRNPLVLYNCLRTGVKGFDTIIRSLENEPKTDDELMELLVSEFEECNMETSAVAKRHREWLQAIGYVEREDGLNRLTDSGKAIADQLKGISSLDLEPGSSYNRKELHREYGGSIQGGIAPSRDEPVVLLFTGGTGEKHGYRDEIRSDGTVVYTGEGQRGDMEMQRGNRVIRDHVEEGRELHLFEMGDYGVRYVGQFMYAGHFYEELPDVEGEMRRAIRFELAPVGQGTSSQPSQESYNSLETACDDIRTKLSSTEEGLTWLTAHIGRSVIEDWSRALSELGPSEEVDPKTAATLDQLRTVYESLESELEAKAEELWTGTIEPFSQVQTLFLGWVRIIQDDIGVSNGLLNKPRLNSILHDSYTTSDFNGSDQPVITGHTVIDHIHDTEPAVYKFTAPPEYWLTSVEYGCVSIEDRHAERWEEIDAGDVAILHSRAEPSADDLGDQRAGLIGVAILGDKFEKDDPWWWDEHEASREFSMIVSFERLFLTGDIDGVDTTRGIDEKDNSTVRGELDALTANCLPTERANEICEKVGQKAFPSQGMFARFRTDEDEVDYDRPRALIEAMSDELSEVTTVNPYKPFEGVLTEHEDEILGGLHFPDNQGYEILESIETSLNAGKHVLLTGPPGTGKTEIAERVCEFLADEYPYLFSGFEMTTATADWSTFDTVGGYMPSESAEDGENLSFNPGIVLNRLKNAETGVQSNELTIIDELNRADIDKAFGQLFTLLSGQSVQLPYTVSGKEVELTTYEDVDSPAASNQYVVPQSWRIFATMNAYDKTSLYEMSYAFMRRFAFVRVPAPELEEATAEGEDPAEELVHEYAAAWELDISTREANAVGHLWRKANSAVDERAIGPAIIEDVLRYVTHHSEDRLEYHLTQAVISYIFPQLEGVPKRKQIVREITAVRAIETDLLEDAAREMLQVTLTQDE